MKWILVLSLFHYTSGLVTIPFSSEKACLHAADQIHLAADQNPNRPAAITLCIDTATGKVDSLAKWRPGL